MRCFITRTASFLPGAIVENHEIGRYLGALEGEDEVREKILSMNGIRTRYYAQDADQHPTFDVYEMGAEAVSRLHLGDGERAHVSHLAAGTTFAPLAAPGYASILHSRLAARGLVERSVEIDSHSGICTSAANALVSTFRSVSSGEHESAICVGAEHSSEVLKSKAIQPVDDRSEHANLRSSRWFMSVFLRFMLSDGAGAFLIQNSPADSGLSLRVNWTHSRSFAHAAPLCMQMESRSALLSQDVSILSKHLFPAATQFVEEAFRVHDDTLSDYQVVLPHMSSFFFRRKMERVIARNCGTSQTSVPFWTNLAEAGNTGAASIFIMLDQFLREGRLNQGDRMLLFIPESGQFNFVLISLTATAS